jgi:hypothetical protein
MLINLESLQLVNVLRNLFAQLSLHEPHLIIVDIGIYIDTLICIMQVPLIALKLIDFLLDSQLVPGYLVF